MCDFCNVKPGEEQFGYTFAPTILWTKVKRLENNMLQLVFGYGEDPNDQAWLHALYCPMCGEKQEIQYERIKEKSKHETDVFPSGKSDHRI